MVDALEQPIEIGDILCISVNSSFEFCQLLGFSDRFIKVSCKRILWQQSWGDKRNVAAIAPTRHPGYIQNHNSFIYRYRFHKNLNILKMNINNLVDISKIKSDKKLLKEWIKNES